MCPFVYTVLWLHLNVYRQSWVFATETWSLRSLHIKCLVLRGGLCQCLALVDLQGALKTWPKHVTTAQDICRLTWRTGSSSVPGPAELLRQLTYFENTGTRPGWKGSEFSLMRKWVLREASKQRSLERADRMGNKSLWKRQWGLFSLWCGVDPKDLDKNNWGEQKKKKEKKTLCGRGTWVMS